MKEYSTKATRTIEQRISELEAQVLNLNKCVVALNDAVRNMPKQNKRVARAYAGWAHFFPHG